MEIHEYTRLDAVALAELVHTGQVTAVEVEHTARRALERAHADLNALTGPLYDPVPDHAPNGPLGGVPFVVKDSGPFVRGTPFCLGSRALVGAVAHTDHALMTRFRAAGLAALGQSTVPELALSLATESRRYGTTRNPWSPERGVGGSSGGAAALVAAGAVPLAHGSDGGGSLRVPASACGLVGLKPSRGRTPCGPLTGEAGFGMVGEFALTRTVRDTAHLLDAVSAPAVGEKYALPPPGRPYAEAVRTDPGRLRVAVTTTPWAQATVDPQVADATLTTAHLLEWIGHTVQEDRPVLDPQDTVEAMVLLAVSTGAALLRGPRGPDPQALEALSRQVLSEARRRSALEVMAGLDAQHRVTRALGLFMAEYDLLLTPTLGRLPAPHGTFDPDEDGHTPRTWFHRAAEYAPFSAPANVAGLPALSLPLAQSREGLPIGVQLMAAPGREDVLLAVGSQLQQAAPWEGRCPPLHV
ncbi:amidase [Nocardiopsis arvandica]|uniref:Amidase n=1 Tax=Nocardiopsis sinuspersici TaxID=501010 RepID=A0A7Y9XFY6_9ACTN|nr:amidase family protein [Nocardiopsis sinuspersici]NYH55091.1 amidase [Nocardiopsis sinuspersici]